MKGKYITTDIILACLASANASRKLAEQKRKLHAEASKKLAAKIDLILSLNKEAA